MSTITKRLNPARMSTVSVKLRVSGFLNPLDPLIRGLRLSQLVALNVADLDFFAETVRVTGKGRKEKPCCMASSDPAPFIEAVFRPVRKRTDAETPLSPCGGEIGNRYVRASLIMELVRSMLLNKFIVKT